MSNKLVLTIGMIVIALNVSAHASTSIPLYKEVERLVGSVQRPFVLINEREAESLKKTGKFDKLIHSYAEELLKTNVAIPAHGGHFHHFFCDCGTQLTAPAGNIEQPFYTCPACGKAFSGERYDAAVRRAAHMALSGMANALAIAYAVEKDRRYSDKAAEVLIKYAQAYPGPHTDNIHGGMIYQSLDESTWIISLAHAYDLIYNSPSLTDSDKRNIEDKLLRPAAQGIRISGGYGGNWGSWHLSAVGIVGYAIRDAEMVEFSLKTFETQIRDLLGDDGLWPESVHTYHFYPMEAFLLFAEASHRAGIDIYNLQPKPGKGLHAMFSAPIQYMYPNTQLPAVNDGWYSAWLPTKLYKIAHAHWDDPEFTWVVENAKSKPITDKIKSLDGLSFYGLLYGSDLPANPKLPVFKSTNFFNFGLCTLRNDRMMLTFHYGRHLGHGQPDKLSFTLFANDTLLSADYGTPGYGSKVMEWYRSTAAHNTVLVDGNNQANSKQHALDAFFAGKSAQFAQCTATDIYPGISQTRKILVLGGACFVIDNLTSKTKHDFDWLFRCNGDPKVLGSYAAAEPIVPPSEYIKLDSSRSFDDLYRMTWETSKCNLAFGLFGGGTVSLGKCPAENDMKHISFVMCRQHGKDASFIAAFAPSNKNKKAIVEKVDGLVWVKTGNESVYLSVGSQSNKKLVTDAELAAIRVVGGKVTGAFISNGSELTWKGKSLIAKSKKVDCAEI